jgi:hypothetical protein
MAEFQPNTGVALSPHNHQVGPAIFWFGDKGTLNGIVNCGKREAILLVLFFGIPLSPA